MQLPQPPEIHPLKRLQKVLYVRLVRPFIQAEASPQQVAWGAAIGMFIAMTPTVGVQLYLVMLVWVLLRYPFKLGFSLPVALAMVFISNPFTLVFIYYGDYLLGDALLAWTDHPSAPFSYGLWKLRIAEIMAGQDGQPWARWLLQGLREVWEVFGLPLFVGGVALGMLLALPTYPFALWLAHRLRRQRVRQRWNARSLHRRQAVLAVAQGVSPPQQDTAGRAPM